MARCSRSDPVEKFRFKLTIFDFDPTGLTTVDSSQDNSVSAGFSEVLLPKSNVTEIPYRENIDAPRFTKIPGLVRYEALTLRRGVSKKRELYNWYKKINDDINTLSFTNDLLSNQNFIPILDPDYRRDIVIEVLDRDGATRRAWFLFNAFPIGYKGGNDLNASTNEILLEELTISYEAFVELESSELHGPLVESREAAKRALIAGGIRTATDIGGFL